MAHVWPKGWFGSTFKMTEHFFGDYGGYVRIAGNTLSVFPEFICILSKDWCQNIFTKSVFSHFESTFIRVN